MWCQAVTTNVPGPRIPLYVLGKRMTTATAYVPIAGGTRCSIGIFSYLNTMTFGINADFDGYPDVDVLSGGIRKGIEELLALAAEKGTAKAAGTAEPQKEPAATSTPTKRAPAKSAPSKSTAASGPAKTSAASGSTGRTTATERTAAPKAAPGTSTDR
jgi:hypothetical protein